MTDVHLRYLEVRGTYIRNVGPRNALCLTPQAEIESLWPVKTNGMQASKRRAMLRIASLPRENYSTLACSLFQVSFCDRDNISNILGRRGENTY